MRKLYFVAVLLPLNGCASYTPAEVAKPSDISIKKAMAEVAEAIHTVQAAYPPEKRVGLIVDEVDIQFNVAAKATNGGTQQLTIADVPLHGPGGNIGASFQGQQSAEGNRGNTITVKLKNIATADMTKGAFRGAGTQQKPATPDQTKSPPQGSSSQTQPPASSNSPGTQKGSNPVTDKQSTQMPSASEGSSNTQPTVDCRRYKCVMNGKLITE